MSKLKIAIIEDETKLLEVYVEYFSPHSIEVHTATTLKEGLLLLDVHDHFDAIIVDYKLPDGHGTELVKKAQQKFNSIYTIIVSGLVEVFEIKNAHVDAVFRKPSKLSDILEKLQALHTD